MCRVDFTQLLNKRFRAEGLAEVVTLRTVFIFNYLIKRKKTYSHFVTLLSGKFNRSTIGGNASFSVYKAVFKNVAIFTGKYLC